MKLLRFLPILLLPFMLASCGATLGNVGTVIGISTPQILDATVLGQIHLTYQTYQAAAVSLRKNFHQCTASETPSASDLCYKRATYSAVQIINDQAGAAVAAIDQWATDNPTIDASALVDGFNKIVTQGTALITAAKAGHG